MEAVVNCLSNKLILRVKTGLLKLIPDIAVKVHLKKGTAT